jgi:hypothetical protein
MREREREREWKSTPNSMHAKLATNLFQTKINKSILWNIN